MPLPPPVPPHPVIRLKVQIRAQDNPDRPGVSEVTQLATKLINLIETAELRNAAGEPYHATVLGLEL